MLQVYPEKVEYRAILARSRFSLCPRGSGSGSIRFWESLQAGAIPVVISDDLLLPPNFSWDKAIIVIPEDRITEINTILRAITPEEELSMRAQCLEAYALFCGENFIKTIIDFYADK